MDEHNENYYLEFRAYDFGFWASGFCIEAHSGVPFKLRSGWALGVMRVHGHLR